MDCQPPSRWQTQMESLCGHLMPTEYADYVTFVFGYVHVWCCHKFVCLCVVEGQRAGTCMRCNSGLCGFICTTYLIRRVISCGFYVNFSHPWERLFLTTGIVGPTYCDGKEGTVYTFAVVYVYVSHDHQPSYHWCEQICIMAFFSVLWTVLTRKTDTCTCHMYVIYIQPCINVKSSTCIVSSALCLWMVYMCIHVYR